MSEGTQQTITLSLLKGNLNFIWNHGWYHSSEEYDTDYECSFSILDWDGNELYSGSDLEDGVFLTYNNNCEEAPLACYPVRNLDGSYLWVNDEEFGAHLTWDKPTITSNLDHFIVYRNDIWTKEGEGELIAEIPYTGAEHYDFFDNMVDVIHDIGTGDSDYAITCVFIKNEEKCESEATWTDPIFITDIDETTDNTVNVYPNPTSGMVNVIGNGTMHITVCNLLGQKVMETKAETTPPLT